MSIASVEAKRDVSVEFVTWKIVPKGWSKSSNSQAVRDKFVILSFLLILPCVSSVTDQRRRSNEVRTNTEVVYSPTACVSATTVFLRIIAGGEYFFFRTKRGRLFEEGDYFKYCSLEVVH